MVSKRKKTVKRRILKQQADTHKNTHNNKKHKYKVNIYVQTIIVMVSKRKNQ